MPTPSMTVEQKQEAVDALEKYGSQTAAADALGLPKYTSAEVCDILARVSVEYTHRKGPTRETRAVSDFVAAVMREFYPKGFAQVMIIRDEA